MQRQNRQNRNEAEHAGRPGLQLEIDATLKASSARPATKTTLALNWPASRLAAARLGPIGTGLNPKNNAICPEQDTAQNA